jgi:hypothetical protein
VLRFTSFARRLLGGRGSLQLVLAGLSRAQEGAASKPAVLKFTLGP